jgi:hypothetical protein
MFTQFEDRLRHLSSSKESAVMANTTASKAFAKMEQGHDPEEFVKVARKAVEEDYCPICFYAMSSSEATTFCRARCGKCDALSFFGGINQVCLCSVDFCRKTSCFGTSDCYGLYFMLLLPPAPISIKIVSRAGSGSVTIPHARCVVNLGRKRQPKKIFQGNEGFANLGTLQGQSPARDTSSYSPWYNSPDTRRR